MKNLLTIVALCFSIATAAAQDTKPTKEETIAYIKNIVQDADENYLHWKSGSISQVYASAFSNDLAGYASHFEGKSWDFSYIRFHQINWAKAEKIYDSSSNLLPTSPVKFLGIKFPENSILRVESYNNGTYERQKEEQKNFSNVYIPYLNQEGIYNRLEKAIEHLINLSKKEAEEEKKKDPFAN